MTTSLTPTDVSNRYYSQLLMTQRLQRALLEVELYAYAISKDGLCLLEGNFILSYYSQAWGLHKNIDLEGDRNGGTDD